MGLLFLYCLPDISQNPFKVLVLSNLGVLWYCWVTQSHFLDSEDLHYHLKREKKNLFQKLHFN